MHHRLLRPQLLVGPRWTAADRNSPRVCLTIPYRRHRSDGLPECTSDQLGNKGAFVKLTTAYKPEFTIFEAVVRPRATLVA